MFVPYSTIVQVPVVLALMFSTAVLVVVLVIVYCELRGACRRYLRWIEPMANILTFIFVTVCPTETGLVSGMDNS